LKGERMVKITDIKYLASSSKEKEVITEEKGISICCPRGNR